MLGETDNRRRNLLKLAAISLVGLTAPSAQGIYQAQRETIQRPETPEQALDLLVKGNQRYVAHKLISFEEDLNILKAATEEHQEPLAAVLSCADSRVPVELVFDQSIGHVFVVRVAGNVATPDTIASLEYGVAVLGTPLILVLGHDSCGAVDAAIKSLKDGTTLPGHLPSLVTGVAPAVNAVLQQGGDTLGKAIRQNVIDNVAKLRSATPILSAAVEQNKLKVVGGIYRLKNGRVDMVA